MAEKVCDNCGERVDEAKAFCPACGNAFVEEERRAEASAFEQMDNTVQMGKTMYGQMLSDMGLNISKTPEAIKEEIRTEMIAPIATNTPSIQPPAASPAKKSYLIWIVIGAAAAILLLALLVVVIAAVILYLNR